MQPSAQPTPPRCRLDTGLFVRVWRAPRARRACSDPRRRLVGRELDCGRPDHGRLRSRLRSSRGVGRVLLGLARVRGAGRAVGCSSAAPRPGGTRRRPGAGGRGIVRADATRAAAQRAVRAASCRPSVDCGRGSGLCVASSGVLLRGRTVAMSSAVPRTRRARGRSGGVLFRAACTTQPRWVVGQRSESPRADRQLSSIRPCSVYFDYANKNRKFT